MLAGHDFVVSVRRGGACRRAPTKEHVDLERSIGPIAVVHRLVEGVVDEYAPALNTIEREVVEIERSVCSPEK